MGSMRPAAVYLEESEKEELQQLIKGHSTPQQIAIRARIIVGQPHTFLNKTVDIS